MLESDFSKRIVVTGMGTVNPLGLDVKSTWQAAIEGNSGVRLIEPDELADIEVKIAGQVKGFEARDFFPRDLWKDLRRCHRSSQFSYAASMEALRDANFDFSVLEEEEKADRVGMRIGTGVGGVTYIAEVQNLIREGSIHV